MSPDLSWIDGFYRSIRPYVFWRAEDAVLILPPNRVYKANPTGARLIQHLAAGRRIERFPGLVTDGRRREVAAFFLALRDLYEERNGGPAGGDLPAAAAPDRAESPEAHGEREEAHAERGEARADRPETRADCREAHAERGEAHADRPEARGEREEAHADRPEARAERGEAHADCREAHAEKEEAHADRPEARGVAGPAGAVETVPYDFDFTRLPVLGEIAVTYRCNNFCRFCYAGASFVPDAASATPAVPARPGPEMTTRECLSVIRLFRDRARVPFFSFTGGEPLLRRDLEKLIRAATRMNLRTNLITNGTLATPERARSLYRAGLRTAQVSLEAPDAATHDELTQVPGSFGRTLAGIAALKAAGISVQTNTTITRVNRDLVPRMPAFLATLGVERFSMNLFIPTGRGAANGDLFVSYTEIGPVVDAVRRAAFAAGLTFYWYSPTPHCHYNPIARGMGNKSCAAMDGLISVNPRGEVLPCSSYNEPIGNLLTTDFDAVWFSARALHFKHKHAAPAACRRCDRFVACQGACPLYWAWAGEGELAAAGRQS